MIVRLMGEGQYRVDDALLQQLHELDDRASAAADAGDEESLDEALEQMFELVKSNGTPLADDDLELSGLLAFVLRGAGYLVLEAPDGPSALEIFRREQPDLVVLDVNMPRLSGLDVLKKIREDGDTPVRAVKGEGYDVCAIHEDGSVLAHSKHKHYYLVCSDNGAWGVDVTPVARAIFGDEITVQA